MINNDFLLFVMFFLFLLQIGVFFVINSNMYDKFRYTIFVIVHADHQRVDIHFLYKNKIRLLKG